MNQVEILELDDLSFKLQLFYLTPNPLLSLSGLLFLCLSTEVRKSVFPKASVKNPARAVQVSRCGSHWRRIRPSFPAISSVLHQGTGRRPRGPEVCKPAGLQHLSLDLIHSSPISLETPDIREIAWHTTFLKWGNPGIDVAGVRESDPLLAQPALPFFGLTMSHCWHHLKYCWSWSWWPYNVGKFSFCEAFPPLEGDPSPFPLLLL